LGAPREHIERLSSRVVRGESRMRECRSDARCRCAGCELSRARVGMCALVMCANDASMRDREREGMDEKEGGRDRYRTVRSSVQEKTLAVLATGRDLDIITVTV